MKKNTRKIAELLETHIGIEEKLLICKRKNMTCHFIKQTSTVIKKSQIYLNCLNSKLNI